eukprot:CAMPEP_0184326596 /NCGR_PEP_ID=MMETSP1049-20130417/142647_1 /TAXON_ID=77928 /ORGANISM="Proteomonas sulcata, Strain CCMP704" /LENGTH=126 /DNA_ID=CAMNT_0026648799 /DNA_START=120 /DNA_END=500 /DNA_ORIENTATION=+
MEQGAIREAAEEANAQIKIKRMLAVFSLKHVSLVQMMFLSELLSPEFSAGEESLEVKLFPIDAVPWEDLAFPSVNWALWYGLQELQKDDSEVPEVHGNPDTPGGSNSFVFNPKDGSLQKLVWPGNK